MAATRSSETRQRGWRRTGGSWRPSTSAPSSTSRRRSAHLYSPAPMQTGPPMSTMPTALLRDLPHSRAACCEFKWVQLAKAPFRRSSGYNDSELQGGARTSAVLWCVPGEQCSRRWNTLQRRACRGDLPIGVVYDELTLTENAVFVRRRRF